MIEALCAIGAILLFVAALVAIVAEKGDAEVARSLACLPPPPRPCGEVYSHPSVTRPQPPCSKRLGHEGGPETDWKRDWHSNGAWSWRSERGPR